MKSLIILTLVVFGLISCSKDNGVNPFDIPATPIANLQGSTWYWQKYMDGAGHQINIADVVNPSDVFYLTFYGDTLVKGRGGCNYFNSKCNISGNSITIAADTTYYNFCNLGDLFWYGITNANMILKTDNVMVIKSTFADCKELYFIKK